MTKIFVTVDKDRQVKVKMEGMPSGVELNIIFRAITREWFIQKSKASATQSQEQKEAQS